MSDYQKIAGTIMFGKPVLDNAMRGHFIEAVVYHALTEAALAKPEDEWRHVGLGWGPWDLQRGTFFGANRVRVQVKTAAQKQLWTPTKVRPRTFSLGWRKARPLPTYFTRDFGGSVGERTYGSIEPGGYRCDLFLLAWHPEDSPSEADRNRTPRAMTTLSFRPSTSARQKLEPKASGSIACAAGTLDGPSLTFPVP